ncbi:glycosyl hydrolase 2 galactose-binding domain-containing protein [Streptomyces longwoodensis]|uniref:glycosyl hydrolase 2 galactose-binding domain-containing protein n=1 Tax=Streptomyces longwoodensis TaxID=68231 RepID=UPI00324470CE
MSIVPDLFDGAHWEMLATVPGEVAGPDLLRERSGWIPAEVPGTAAGTLRDVHGDARAQVEDYDGQDWWWRCVVEVPSGAARWWLDLRGLATIADVWVNGQHVVHSRNMFRSHGVEMVGLAGLTEVVLRCAAASPLVVGRRPRPRWKAPLVRDQGWRHLRTSLLGRAPGWLVPSPIVGPWRDVALFPVDRPVVVRRVLRTWMEGESGIVEADVSLSGAVAVTRSRIRVGDQVVECDTRSPTRHVARLRLPVVRRWWPHTHGEQPLYPVDIELDGMSIALGRVGFRTVETNAGGGFGLRVNGVPVFAAGVCWTPLDPVSLQSDHEALVTAVQQACDGGFNLIRLVGGTIYETDDFHDICDKLGVLVWQDCMLAALDPPEDDAFTEELTAEVAELADRLAGRPSTTVVCGGDETERQPLLLGLPPGEPEIRAVARTIPQLLRDRLPGVPYVTSSPSCGGALAHRPGEGISHYFGVGAYLRAVSDVRAAGVRFAAACLAFSIPPEEESVETAFGGARVAGHAPRWKAAVPRDRTASWDFEDVRDHYIKTVLGVEPDDVRRTDPERYLDLGRAAVCSVMTAVLSQWRRPHDPCAGAVVMALRDTVPGAGWGLVDVYGRPKAPWYTVRRVLARRAILVHDEGLNGMFLTVVNQTSAELRGRLEVRTWGTQGGVLDEGHKDIGVPAGGSIEVSVDGLLGRFTDLNHAYRFGPRSRDVMEAVFVAADGRAVAENVAVLGERARPPRAGVVRGVLRRDTQGWIVDVTADELAQWVVVSATGYRAEDAWFHMAPGTTRSVRLSAESTADSRPPVARLRALNAYATSAALDDSGE